ncbi:MAG TPA: protein kinase, partial [Myxococcaceae bacterium]|nr:protein kinase [Myxococcaceae bacterium]
MDALPLPPDLALDRVLTPDRTFLVRVQPSSDLAVARRCSGRAAVLRRRLERLAAAAPAAVVVESKLIEHRGTCWAVRPWVSGRPLRALRRDGPVPAEEALRVLSGVADAAAALNARGLVHGRVHAGNAILDDAGQIRIVDGLDALALPTMAEVSLGPEILQGEGLRPNTDVYGIALLLYEFLVGAHPFTAASVYESIRRVLYEQPGDWQQVPVHLVPALRAALARRPSRRTRTVEVFAASLRQDSPTARRFSLAAERESIRMLVARVSEGLAPLSRIAPVRIRRGMLAAP